jgi:hypothetical protein
MYVIYKQVRWRGENKIKASNDLTVYKSRTMWALEGYYSGDVMLYGRSGMNLMLDRLLSSLSPYIWGAPGLRFH